MNAALGSWMLLRTLVEGTVLVLLIALVVRGVPRLSAATRAGLWWLASAKLLLGLAPGISLASLARRAPAIAGWVAAPARVAQERWTATVGPLLPPTGSAPVAPTAGLDLVSALAMGAVGVWAVGAVVFAVHLVREQRRLDAIWRQAKAFDPARLSSWAWSWLPAPGWAAVPAVRVSERTEVPLTLGWLKPRILLPGDIETVPEEELRLALAHEFVHVRRHDLLFGWVPAVAHVVFWFYPLAAWCSREYNQAREEACDVEALRLTGAAARDYGELLLRFGVARSVPSTAVALCGSRTRRALTRRLLMLERTTPPSLPVRIAGAALLLLGAIAILPIRLVSNDASAHEGGKPSSELGKAMPSDLGSDAFGYLFLRKGESSTTGSARMTDFDMVQKVQRKYDEDLLMVRLKDDYWVIRDPDVRSRAWAALAPQRSVEQSRRPLERQMNALAREMQSYDSRMGDLDERMDDLDQSRERLEGQIQKLGADDGRAREARVQLDQIAVQREQIARERGELDQAREALMRQREPLYRQSMAFYEDGERMRATLTRKLKDIVQSAIDAGLAERVY